MKLYVLVIRIRNSLNTEFQAVCNHNKRTECSFVRDVKLKSSSSSFLWISSGWIWNAVAPRGFLSHSWAFLFNITKLNMFPEAKFTHSTFTSRLNDYEHICLFQSTAVDTERHFPAIQLTRNQDCSPSCFMTAASNCWLSAAESASSSSQLSLSSSTSFSSESSAELSPASVSAGVVLTLASSNSHSDPTVLSRDGMQFS